MNGFIIYSLIEDEAKRQRKPAFEILVDEWGTSGKQRPTIQHLIEVLIKVELFQAADFLSEDLLGQGPVERPERGPSAKISSSIEDTTSFSLTPTTMMRPTLEAANEHISDQFMQQKYSTASTVVCEEFDTPLPHLSYAELEYLTDNFNLNPIAQNGRKLGAGAFGTVFLGKLGANPHLDSFGVQIYQKLKLSLQTQIAVKRLHSQKV